MLRLLGSMMIIAGCLGLGIWYRGQITGRVRSLRLLQQILDLLESEIRYGRATLPECCLHIGSQLAPPFEACFEKLCARLKAAPGNSFAVAFRETMSEGLDVLPLRREDREAFLQFVSENGYTDGQMQLLAIQRSRDILKNTIERLERENTEKCRMAVGLGAMSGLLLILVLW